MSILGSFTKQPAEVTDYDIDYSEWLTSGDTVESAVATVTPATDLVIDSVFTSDTRIKAWLSAGTDGTTYKIEVTMTTADGRIKQDEFKVKVKET